MKTAKKLFKSTVDEYMVYCDCYTSETSFKSAKALMVNELREALAEHDKEIIKLIDNMIKNIDTHKILITNERKQSYELALSELKQILEGGDS